MGCTQMVGSSTQAIVGGDPIDIEEVPWAVSLVSDGIFYCGGSLIAPDLVLTAQHCVDAQAFSDRQFQVIAGRMRRSEEGVGADVSEFYENRFTDMALLRLAEPLPLGPRIATIPMLDEENSHYLEEAGEVRVSGWGLADCGSQPDELRTMVRPLAPLEFARAFGEETMVNIASFATSREGQYAWSGDSGSGAVVIGPDGQPWLAGVFYVYISIGGPNLYSGAADHAEWIGGVIAGEVLPDP